MEKIENNKLKNLEVFMCSTSCYYDEEKLCKLTSIYL